MKKFILVTKSDSSDDYIYFIESKTTPTNNDLEKFLLTAGNDIGFESVVLFREIIDSNFQKIID